MNLSGAPRHRYESGKASKLRHASEDGRNDPWDIDWAAESTELTQLCVRQPGSIPPGVNDRGSALVIPVQEVIHGEWELARVHAQRR